MTTTSGISKGQGGRARFRAFAPLWVWLCLSLLLLGWDTYQKWAERTLITFMVLVDGAPPTRNLTVMLDGVPVQSGNRVKVGSRVITIEEPGIDPFEREFSAWFGNNDLGIIQLTQSRGTIAVSSEPVAAEIRVVGNGVNTSTTNIPTTVGPLLIGPYTVTADFGLFVEERRVNVRPDETTRVEFKPAVGTLNLSSAPTNARYRLVAGANRRISLEGESPAVIGTLPIGEYQLAAWRGDYVKETTVNVTSSHTNSVRIDFPYAEIRFETTPAGADVLGTRGAIGTTPLTIPELVPGEYWFRIVKDGHTPVDISVEAIADSVHTIKTNLMNQRYAFAMRHARELATGDSPDIETALLRVNEALDEIPNDPQATALKAQLASTIENQAMQAQRREMAIQEAALLQRRKDDAAEVFQNATQTISNTELFDAHLWTVKTNLTSSSAALRRLLATDGSGWKLGTESKATTDTFVFHCQASTKALSNVKRDAVLVMSQVAPDEVHVYAKFFDYQATKVGLSLTSGFKKDGLIPVHPDYFKPEDEAAVQERRKTVPEDFRQQLFKELE